LNSQRTYCERCARAQRACICAWIRPIEHSPYILILQHPLEVHQAKGSARLLHLCLTRSQLIVGECFDERDLRELLEADGCQPVLLYPAMQSETDGVIAPVAFQPQLTIPPQRLRLVALDATWRKSRKMLYLNPYLQTLPRLSLNNAPLSHYRIRKAHHPDQRSTLEACCYALQHIDPAHHAAYGELLEAFDAFVEQQLRFIPA
jgi:DTW domain-containing protein